MNTASPISSRDRILSAAKSLFARNGYENTSTVAIARQAGTSESQLMKHFGSKQGLLSAIFDLGWSTILDRVRAIHTASGSSTQKLVEALEVLMFELERDTEIKTLMTLEGRRVRKDHTEVCLSQGFVQFCDALEDILNDMKKEGALRPEANVKTIRAAFTGMVDGMLFDQLTCTRSGGASQYRPDETKRVLEALVSGLAGEHTDAMRIAR